MRLSLLVSICVVLFAGQLASAQSAGERQEERTPITVWQEKQAEWKLDNIRERILNGENFGTLAYLYSDDPGSARNNGHLGFVTRKTLHPDVVGPAFTLEPGEISKVVKSRFGFHLFKAGKRTAEGMELQQILIRVEKS